MKQVDMLEMVKVILVLKKMVLKHVQSCNEKIKYT